MKKNNKIILGTILFSFLTIVTLIAGNGEVQRDKGNGEVTLAESCFSTTENLDKCIKKLYPKVNVDNIAFKPIMDKILKVVKNRGDGLVIFEDINLTNQERFVIHANISEAKKPVSINIPTAKTTQTKTSLIIDIDTKDIKDKVIVTNKDNEVLIEYTVID
jgi:glutamate synthase domain-containing protein 1